MNPEFDIYRDGTIIKCRLTCKERTYYAEAICHDDDTPNVELGKKLALARCELQFRQYQLEGIRAAKDIIRNELDFSFNPVAKKVWMQYHQDICKQEEIQLHRIRNTKHLIKDLQKGIL